MNREVHVRICGSRRVRLPPATRLKTVVVSDVEKASVRRQVGIRKMSNPEPLLTCLSSQEWHRNHGH